MYLILKKEVLRKILDEAFKKAGNIRILAKLVRIPRSTLSEYHMEKSSIKDNNLKKLTEYLKISINDLDIIEKFPDNWKQIKGGNRRVEIMKQKGNYLQQLKIFQKNSSKRLKLWHKKMKRENPEKYYLMQYEKFKKIGGYKFLTENGEKVRNKLEKDTADFLKKNGFKYKYEPLIKADNKYFFPDFLINDKIIIECTEWRGFDKAIKLKDKIEHLQKQYKVFVLIPKPLKRYYETLNQHLLLGMDDLIKTLKSS